MRRKHTKPLDHTATQTEKDASERRKQWHQEERDERGEETSLGPSLGQQRARHFAAEWPIVDREIAGTDILQSGVLPLPAELGWTQRLTRSLDCRTRENADDLWTNKRKPQPAHRPTRRKARHSCLALQRARRP